MDFCKLGIPTYDFKLKKVNDIMHIWDSIRNKYIKITAEEWVRQNFIMFLINYRGYKKNLISLEKCFDINTQRKRYDILIYKNNEAKMLIECKAPAVNLTSLQQLQVYNCNFKVPFIVLTNGIKYCSYKINYADTISYKVLTDIPNYDLI